MLIAIVKCDNFACFFFFFFNFFFFYSEEDMKFITAKTPGKVFQPDQWLLAQKLEFI